MSKQQEALRIALEALKQIDEAMPFPVAKLAQKVIREALAQSRSDEEQPAQQQEPNYKELYEQACERLDVLDKELAKYEQPAQQEPVAYAVYHRMGGSKSLHWPEQHSPDGDANEYQLLPLYTSPQQASRGLR